MCTFLKKILENESYLFYILYKKFACHFDTNFIHLIIHRKYMKKLESCFIFALYWVFQTRITKVRNPIYYRC